MVHGLACFSALQAAVAGASFAGSKPNFVIFFSDDTGFGDLGFNGATPSETPNLDALAAKGLRFADFHSGSSVCTPSRAALLTGRLGARTGVTHNFGLGSQRGLDIDETTIAEVLKTAGYDTKMIGKWHLGHHAGYHPSYRGFDEYVGLPYSNDMGCLDKQPTTGWNWVSGKEGHKPACAADLAIESAGPEIWGDYAPNGGTNAVPLYNSTAPGCTGKDASGDCNKDIVEQPVVLETLNSRYRNEAIQFIEAHKCPPSSSCSSNPFFLYMPFAHMHVPQGFTPEFVKSSTSKTVYGDALRELDHTIGAVVDSLRSTGLEDSTMVVYTADNGPWNVKCSLGGSQGPFHGTWQIKHGGGGATGKFTTWEGGHREPGLFYWKGHVSAGVTHALSSTMDLMPTLAALAGASLPASRSWDGLDLAPVLFKGEKQGHEYLYHPDGKGNLNAMRYGDLKAFWQTYSAGACNSKLGVSGKTINHDPPLIFNLTADPAESTPIRVSDATLQKLNDIRAATLADIATTLKHKGHYESGGKSDWACSNQASAVCRKASANGKCPGTFCPQVPASSQIGCFLDKQNAAKDCDFEFLVTGQCKKKKVAKNKKMSVELCNAKCLAAGDFKYFAVQSGGTGCFCGNSYGRWGEDKRDGACAMPCLGNGKETCGGNNHNLVYHVQQPATEVFSAIV